MLIRYGGPNLQMDFVSFVHWMLRVGKMEGEPVGRREAQDFLCTPCGWPACPQEGGQQPVQKRQVRDPGALWLCAVKAACVSQTDLHPRLLQRQRFEVAHSE